MNDVVDALHNDREKFRQYKDRDNHGWESVEPRASFNEDPDSMSDNQLVKQHSELLKMQKQEDYLNNSHTAKDIAKRRNKLWKEATKRGIEKQLL